MDLINNGTTLLSQHTDTYEKADDITEIQDGLWSYDIFPKGFAYIHAPKLFYACFREIPSLKTATGINYKRAIQWIESELDDCIANKFSRESYHKKRKNMNGISNLYLLKERIFIDIDDCGEVNIVFANGAKEKADSLLTDIMRAAVSRSRTTHISIVTAADNGLRLMDVKNKRPKLRLDTHYNDDLALCHKNFVKRLRAKNSSGLLLLHGAPGTGKSTYLRYLIHCLSKRVIFLSPRLAGDLDSPMLVNLLLENRDSVLIIEDAEDLLVPRDGRKDNSGISTLLNLTDGLLGESLGIHVVSTFNTNIRNIDKALLRKGRLIGMYEFKALCAEKASVLLKQLGMADHSVNQPMTLAELFNYREREQEFSGERRRVVGFGT